MRPIKRRLKLYFPRTQCRRKQCVIGLPGKLAYLAATLLLGLVMATAAGAQLDDSDWYMYRDPELLAPEWQIRFPPGLVELWTRTLAAPQLELRRRVAADIAEGQRRGLTGLEATVEPLTKLLEQPDQDRMLRLTVAQALVALDARQTAALLFENLTEGDLDMAEIVEPALARWKHGPAGEMWLKRIGTAITFRRSHILAIQGLTALGEMKALPRIRELALGRHTPVQVRLAAATGLGQLQPKGLEKLASPLMQDKSRTAVVDRIVAARLLANHRGVEAEQLAAELAVDSMPSVQAIALDSLFRNDPKLVMPLVKQTLQSSDANVRQVVADALISVARLPTPENIAVLSSLLDDPNPKLRRHVRKSFVELAGIEALHDLVIVQGKRVLSEDGWRGQEQAIHLLVALDDKTIVDRLLVLLESPRPEVHTRAAWGLCQLNVPATIEPIFAVFKAKTERRLAAEPLTAGTDIQLSHLAQAIGRMKYAPADAVLRKYIPKGGPLDVASRSSAIWALGYLYVDRRDDDLAELLRQRLNDTDSEEPEDDLVRRFAAIAIGRMKAEKTLPTVRKIFRREGIGGPVGLAAGWALHEMTGQPIPEIRPNEFWDIGWSLSPETNGVDRDDGAGDQ